MSAQPEEHLGALLASDPMVEAAYEDMEPEDKKEFGELRDALRKARTRQRMTDFRGARAAVAKARAKAKGKANAKAKAVAKAAAKAEVASPAADLESVGLHVEDESSEGKKAGGANSYCVSAHFGAAGLAL